MGYLFAHKSGGTSFLIATSEITAGFRSSFSPNGSLIPHVMLQAYHEMADFLITQGAVLKSKLMIPEPPKELEEKVCRPIKKLKGFVQGATLTEHNH